MPRQPLEAVIDTVYAAVARGERVALTGFGIFERRERAARMARNPATGAAVRVKKTAVPAFRAGAEFKAITSGARKLAVKRAEKAVAVAKKVRRAGLEGPGQEGREGGAGQEGGSEEGSGQEGSGQEGSREEGSRQEGSGQEGSSQEGREARTGQEGVPLVLPA